MHHHVSNQIPPVSTELYQAVILIKFSKYNHLQQQIFQKKTRPRFRHLANLSNLESRRMNTQPPSIQHCHRSTQIPSRLARQIQNGACHFLLVPKPLQRKLVFGEGHLLRRDCHLAWEYYVKVSARHTFNDTNLGEMEREEINLEENLQPGAMMLALISNGTREVASIFIKCVVAALLCPYANPPDGVLLNPAMELVAIT